jgi:thiol-disulfide isomerase/thioredoxin
VEGVLLAVRVVLAAVFVAAAFGKLADRAGTRAAVEGFGAPAALVRPIALLLPFAELAAAGLLLFESTAVEGAIAALGLLVLFSAAIAINLARGRKPDCHCFGQIHSEPIGASTLARNAALAVAAGFVIAAGSDDPGPGALGWVDSLEAGSVALGLGIGALAAAWIAYALMRRYGRALRRIDQLESAIRAGDLEVPVEEDPPKLAIGTRAPAFDGLREALAGDRPLFILFSSATCGPCRELAPTVEGWRTEHADLVSIKELSFDGERKVATAYGAEGTPAAILVSAHGDIASRVVYGPEAIEGLFAAALRAAQPPPPGVGDQVPDLTLRTLEGEDADLRSRLAADRETAVVFWRPSCGFCASMRDELRELEANPAEDVPALLIVSAGEADEIRADRFVAPVLHDPAYLASNAFGAGGTPMAVRVAPDGTISSELVGGKDAVLELAGAALGLRVIPAGRG